MRQDVPFAFVKLKELLSSPPVLAYSCSKFTKAFVLHTDVSCQGLAHRICEPNSLTAESHYGITDLEALSVVWAGKHFRAYLLGRQCIFTDHAPLCAMLKAKHPSG